MNRSQQIIRTSIVSIIANVLLAVFKAVVGLLAAAALVLMKVENFGSPTLNTYQFVISCLLFAFAFIATYKFKANPILLILACGLIGLVVY